MTSSANAKKQLEFLPFHAINEFMTDEYRLEVVRTTLNALPSLPVSLSKPINNLIKQVVKIPGFRNSLKAPAGMKARPYAAAFEKNADLVAATLAAWSLTRGDLRQQVHDLLTSRGWEVLPPDADRTRLPGFLTVWPQGEDFDSLFQDYREAYPGSAENQNDVSLMAVWLAGRLPYKFDGEEEESPGE